MLKQATLDVLAQAAEIGLPEAAGVPASAYDPFLRPFIKKRVRHAIDTASAKTRSQRGDHVLRLAFLEAHPAPPKTLDPDDQRAVEEAFEALARPFLPEREAKPKGEAARAQGSAYRVSANRGYDALLPTVAPRKRKVWPVTLSVLGFFILSALTVAGVMAAPFLIPSPLQSFAKTPFGKAAGEPLTDAVVASGANGSPSRQQAARAQVVNKKVEKQIGPGATADLERVLDAIPAAVRSREESTDDALAPLLVHVNALNGDLERAKVPALFHAYASGVAGRRSVWMTSYFVEERETIDVDGKTVRFARGRRMDELNLLDSLLYKGKSEDWAILSMDLVEEQLVQMLLRPLAMDTPMGPTEYAPNDKSAEANLARTAGTAVVAELRAHAKLELEDAITLHSAIARRNDDMVSLNKMGLDIEATSRIRLSPSLVRNLEKWNGSRLEENLIDQILRIDSRMKVYAKPLAPVSAELARIHEDQFVGRLVAAEGDKDPTGASMLATLARPQSCPRLALWLTWRAANDQGMRRVLDALLDPSLREKRVDDEAYVDAVRALFDAPPDQIRERAANAYADKYGRPVPPLTRTH